MSSKTQPNFLFILTDDQGWEDLGCFGHCSCFGRYKIKTPHLDQLARQGIRFNQFYAMSVCSPTRISIMTGQNAARHRATNWINPQKNNGGPNGPPDWNWQGLKSTDVTLPRLRRLAG